MDLKVVHAQAAGDGVVLLRMEDRHSKNTFSAELIAGLAAAFERVGADETCRAVILTGYDSYFACGGTRETLLSLHLSQAKFSDVNLYRLAMDCPVPVIAAMQGHAIGGGLVMGLFCDLVVLSRESLYTANFMKYGFTPGMGATCIVPDKLGTALGMEMLLTAASYRGEVLEKRGVPFPVLSRDQVVPRAMELATSLAEKPRLALVTLKRRLTTRLREQLPEVIASEEAMHAITMRQSEVGRRIADLFGT